MSNCACDPVWNEQNEGHVYLAINSRSNLMYEVCIAVPSVILATFNSSAK